LSEKNILKFDPILIIFFIVCLISLRMLYKNNFLINFSGRNTSHIIVDDDSLWEKLAKSYQLTQREIEIMQHLYKGKSNPDIGKTLFIAEDTVKKHLNHIFRKTGTKNRYELISCITREKSSTSS
jgi:DNA-binding NarL/FixJ family response regulator